jgi:hypothetical protein
MISDQAPGSGTGDTPDASPGRNGRSLEPFEVVGTARRVGSATTTGASDPGDVARTGTVPTATDRFAEGPKVDIMPPEVRACAHDSLV